MNRSEITEQVRAALAAVLNKEMGDIDEDTRLFEDLAMDSTSVIELLMALEDTTDLVIDPDELDPTVFKTLRSLTEYVESSLSDPAVS